MSIILAYIDPGAGSLVIQAAIATLVAAPIVFRQQLGRIVRRIRGSGVPGEHRSPTTPDTESDG